MALLLKKKKKKKLQQQQAMVIRGRGDSNHQVQRTIKESKQNSMAQMEQVK